MLGVVNVVNVINVAGLGPRGGLFAKELPTGDGTRVTLRRVLLMRHPVC